MASSASATADGAAGSGQPAGAVLSPIQRLVAFQQAFWKFLRPHTIRGTILGSMAVTARALIESPVVRPHIQTAGVTHYEEPEGLLIGSQASAQHCIGMQWLYVCLHATLLMQFIVQADAHDSNLCSSRRWIEAFCLGQHCYTSSSAVQSLQVMFRH